MEIREDRQDGVLVIAPGGRLDVTSSTDLERRLLDHLGKGETRFVVDLEGVEYISSAGLRVLLFLAKKLKERSGRVALCALGPAVRQVFDLAGLLPIFAVEPSRQQAVGRVAQGA
ncbi:MAG TPA: STAS domain-containing protein [Vicinamibacteria bacterium]|nr:STAS domain-containing protein [Vicinamibacteria bacterium]